MRLFEKLDYYTLLTRTSADSLNFPIRNSALPLVSWEPYYQPKCTKICVHCSACPKPRIYGEDYIKKIIHIKSIMWTMIGCGDP